MPVLALVIFVVSLVVLVVLFVIKGREAAYPAVARARWRDAADEKARDIKWALLVVEWYLTRLPLLATLLGRRLVRSAALSFAQLARVSAEQAHRLADFVSHKRSFERRETKSDYLKQVIEHKNGNGVPPEAQV